MTNNEKPQFWFFQSPKISYGIGALAVLENIPGRRCFIVTDPGIIQLHLIEHLTAVLKNVKKGYRIFGEIEPDPKEETILRGVHQCRSFSPDLIIALGGGSSIDAAKAIWFLYEHPDHPLDDIQPFNGLSLGQKAKMIAIPTTSGTGAEATWAIVVTRTLPDGSHLKLELANREVTPTYAILDPIFTQSLPPSITLSTAFDAYAHIFEALGSKWFNDFSAGLAAYSARLIRHNLPSVLKNGKDLNARAHLHNAACMAGLSFGNAQTNVGHALGHALGAVFGIPHGLSVGVFIRYGAQYQTGDPNDTGSQQARKAFTTFAQSCGLAMVGETEDHAIAAVISDIQQFQQETGFPRTIAELKITREQLESKRSEIITKALESLGSALSIRPISADILSKILTYAFEGKDIDF
jgi:alcohol dehydrogenase class IV